MVFNTVNRAYYHFNFRLVGLRDLFRQITRAINQNYRRGNFYSFKYRCISQRNKAVAFFSFLRGFIRCRANLVVAYSSVK